MSLLFKDSLPSLEEDTLETKIWLCLRADDIYNSRLISLSESIKDKYTNVTDFVNKKDAFREFINESLSIHDSHMYNLMIESTMKPNQSQELKNYRAKVNRVSLKLYKDVGEALYGMNFTNAFDTPTCIIIHYY